MVTVVCYHLDRQRKYRTVAVMLVFKDETEAWNHIDRCDGGHTKKSGL